MRKLSWVLAGTVALLPVATVATGLGDATVRSYLSQPLVAEIPLRDVSRAQLDEVSVRLADQRLYEEAGIDWTLIQGNINVELADSAAGPVVKVTSRRAIREPILSFLVELRSPSGAVVREYNLLLDPPGTTRVAAAPAPTPRPRIEVPPIEMGGSYGPIPSGMTLGRIAREAMRGTDFTHEQMMQAIVNANPHAFINGDPNRMLADVTLDVPADIALDAPVAPAAPAVAEVDERPRVEVLEPEAEAVEDVADEIVVADDETTELVAEEAEVVAEAPTLEAIDTPVSEVSAQAELLEEDLVVAQAENERLSGKISEMEDQVNRIEELLTLRDEQIERLERLLASEEERAAQLAQEAREAQGNFWVQWAPYMVGGMGLLVLILIMLLTRAKRSERDALELAAQPAEPSMGGAAGGAAAAAATAASAAAEEAPAPAEKSAEPFIPPKAGSDDMGDEVEECILEAEALVVYGLHDQAGNLLSEMLEKYPERVDLRARLARLWGEAGETEKFIAEAEQLKARLESDNPAWVEIEKLGRQCCPDNPLFGGSGDADDEMMDFGGEAQTGEDEADADAFATEDFAEQGDDQISPNEIDFSDFDLDKPMGEDDKAGEQPNTDDIGPLDLDLPERASEKVEEDAFEPLDLGSELDSELGKADETEADTGTSAEQGDNLIDFEPLEIGGDIGGEEDRPSIDAAASDSASDGEAGSGEDESAETKIGLAEAFIDMGDAESARMMLEEVVQAGGPHADKARDLLKKID